MSKAPAFQFYVQDFLLGTLYFTAEETGVYIRLLCHQWDKGFIPSNDDELLKISGGKRKNLVQVKMKFEIGADGHLRNVRLEKERAKQIEFAERQRVNGSRGGRPKKPSGNPKETHEKGLGFSGETQTEPKKSSSVFSLQSSTSSDDDVPRGQKPSPPPPPPPESNPHPYLPLEDNKVIALADVGMHGFVETCHRAGLPADLLARWLDAFHRQLLVDGISLKRHVDYRKHFRDWIKFQTYTKTQPEEFSPVKAPVPGATPEPTIKRKML